MFLNFFSEIKNRIFLIFITWISTIIICYNYKEVTLFFFVKPCLIINNINTSYFIFTNLTELFFTNILMCNFIAIQISVISLILHIFFFITPALYQKEYNKLIFIFIFNFVFLFFIYYNIYKYILPWSWSFFLKFQNNFLIKNIKIFFEPKLHDYLQFCFELYKISVINYQILIILFVYIIHLKDVKIFVKNYRKKLYFFFVIIASIITPPDILSQLFLSFFSLVIFEFIVLVILIKKIIKFN